MGLFGEDNVEERKYKNLLSAIKAKSRYERGNVLSVYITNYVTDIRDGKRNNDFFEFDFLNSVILNILEDGTKSLDDYIKMVKFLLPMGMETPEYEVIKNLIISGNTKIDKRLYGLFNNRLDYIQVTNIIEDAGIENYETIINYALEVSRFCANHFLLKSEIISFASGLKDTVDDVETYFNERLTDAKKRGGVYPIDEKTLALISSEAKKAQALIRKLDNLSERVNTYQESVKALTTQGKKELDDHATLKVEEMRENIEHARTEIIERLDAYILTLESGLKKSSDQIFNQILRDTQDKLRDIRLAATTLSTTTTQELLRIQKASEDSVEALRKYVETEPQLQEYLSQAANSEAVKEALVRMNETKQEQARRIALTSPGIIIPGHDRIVVPANPNVVLPSEQAGRIILPAFDESIPFDVRYQKILDEKKKREENGEIFHHMVGEVINCVMEGDWVYLWGPSGCGKSHIIKQVASLIGIDLVENGKITDKYSIMAYNDPHGRFRATQAFVALVYGKLLSLDEFDNGNTDTQVVLNELYSGLLDTLEHPERERYVTFAEDMTVPIHPNFRMISAGNTAGEGENQIFSSRGKIDESVQERMTPKRFDYDNRVEQRIFGTYENWYGLFCKFRQCCDEYAKKNGLSVAPGMITTRDAAAIKKYISHNSKSVEQVLREKFIQTKDENYLKVIAGAMSKMYGIEDSEDVVIPDGTALGDVEEVVLARKLVYGCRNIKR